MRAPADERRIRALARELGRASSRVTRLYLTGGATAVLRGWRATTLDADLRFEPESDELLRELAALKDRLNINVELTAPLDFVPELPNWRKRSPFLFSEGRLFVHDFDLYSQALSKIERGFVQDLDDVGSMVRDGLVEPRRMLELYEAVETELFRYPAIDPPSLRARVQRAMGASS